MRQPLILRIKVIFDASGNAKALYFRYFKVQSKLQNLRMGLERHWAHWCRSCSLAFVKPPARTTRF